MEQSIKGLCKEIGILKIAQHREVDNHTQSHQKLSLELIVTSVNTSSNKEIHQGGEYQNPNKKTTGFIIEKQGSQKQITVPEFDFFINQSENEIGNGKEYPKISLCEYQWIFFRKSEYVIKPIH